MKGSATSPNSCSNCGAALPSAATAGLCPRCLMAAAMVATQVDAEPAAQPPLPPEQIAPHFPQLEILECLGRGGMGVVYKARQITLNRLVALKLLAPERVGDAKFAGRFTCEAQALAALNHPNIVTIYDFGQAGGFYFLLMEFVDGANLRQLLRTRKFTPEEALAIVPPLCDALQFAHERGIVHRDIKPENLLLDKTGRVKVADFGIAKMLGTAGTIVSAGQPGAPENATETAMGTPSYSAPEQKTDPQHVDSRADIYSLGVVFYEMLTGELPGKHIEPPSRKVQIDVRLDEIVLRALEKKPELRYQQAGDVKTCVETIVRSAATASAGTAGKAFGGAANGAQGRVLPEPRFSKAKMAIMIGVAVVLAAVTATVVVKATFFPAPPDSYFQANYQHFQSLPDGLFVFRPTHFHTPLNGLDYSCEAQSLSGEHLTWMMGRNRTFVQFVTRLYNCGSNQVVWPANMPEGKFDYLYTMLDSKTGERFGVAVRKELGLELLPTNLPGAVLVVEKVAASTGMASAPPSAGLVDLKLKWPPGEHCVVDFDFKQNTAFLLQGRTNTVEEDITLGNQLGFTVVQETPGGGHELELKFLSARMGIQMGDNPMLDYNSADKSAADQTNGVAAVFREMVGSHLRYFLNSSNVAERLDGVDELVRRIQSVPQADPLTDGLKNMFNAAYFGCFTNADIFLPHQAVQPGDTWLSHVEYPVASTGIEVWDCKVVFQSWEMHESHRCARLELQGVMKVKPDANSRRDETAYHARDGVSGGVAWFDPELGQFIEIDIKKDINVDKQPRNPGGTPDAAGQMQPITTQRHQAFSTRLEP